MHLQQHHEHDCRKLGKGIGLPKNARAKIAQSGNRVQNGAYQKNADIAAEDHYRKLPWNFVDDRQHEENSAQQKLVCNGIEILSQQSLLFEAAGEQSVEAVAHTGQHKKD